MFEKDQTKGPKRTQGPVLRASERVSVIRIVASKRKEKSENKKLSARGKQKLKGKILAILRDEFLCLNKFRFRLRFVTVPRE